MSEQHTQATPALPPLLLGYLTRLVRPDKFVTLIMITGGRIARTLCSEPVSPASTRSATRWRGDVLLRIFVDCRPCRISGIFQTPHVQCSLLQTEFTSNVDKESTVKIASLVGLRDETRYDRYLSSSQINHFWTFSE